MSTRNGNWFLTYTGRKFWVTDPRPEDVCVEDIAHHLSLLCRFNGACRVFYSVAQHSLMVEEICPGLPSLLHDATEAYVGDMVRPLKLSMPQYQDAEKRVWLVVCAHFGLDPELKPEVKDADNRALMTERRDIMKPTDHKWSVAAEPVGRIINPLAPALAEKLFLARFEELAKRVRTPGDGQLWEEEIEQHVSLTWNDSFREYACLHFPIASGRWERFYMRLKTPDPELGVQVRPGAMCCECYQKLRKLGLAPFKGTWEGLSETKGTTCKQ